MRPSRELRALLLAYVADASVGDPAFRDVVSDSAEAFHYGSDAHEIWLGGRRIKAIGRAQASAMGRFTFSVKHLAAYEEGTVGWAACAFTMTTPLEAEMGTRVSMVFHREGEQWRAVHVHTSHTVHNDFAMGPEVSAAFDALLEVVEIEHPDLSTAKAPDGSVSIMFTDLESSTALNEALGDQQYVPALQQHHAQVRDAVAAHHGTVLKSLGDGFMIAFASPHEAVQCGIVIERALDRCLVDGVPLRVRIGIHTGRPIADDADFFGRDVAYAARLAATAAGGELVVSDATRALVDRSSTIVISQTREETLKGFQGPQRVHLVDWFSGLETGPAGRG